VSANEKFLTVLFDGIRSSRVWEFPRGLFEWGDRWNLNNLVWILPIYIPCVLSKLSRQSALSSQCLDSSSRNNLSNSTWSSSSQCCCDTSLKLFIVLAQSSALASLCSPGQLEAYNKIWHLQSLEYAATLPLTPRQYQMVCLISRLLQIFTILWNWILDWPMSCTQPAAARLHWVLHMFPGFWCPRNCKMQSWQAQAHEGSCRLRSEGQ